MSLQNIKHICLPQNLSFPAVYHFEQFHYDIRTYNYHRNHPEKAVIGHTFSQFPDKIIGYFIKSKKKYAKIYDQIVCVFFLSDYQKRIPIKIIIGMID